MRAQFFRSSPVIFGLAACAVIAPAAALNHAPPRGDFAGILQGAEMAENTALLSTPSGAPLPSSSLTAKTYSDAFRKASAQRVVGVAERRVELKAHGLVFVNSSVKISITTKNVHGDRAVIAFKQSDTYRTQRTVDSKGDLTATEESTVRVASFSQVGGQWVLQSVDLADKSSQATPLNRPLLSRATHRERTTAP